MSELILCQGRLASLPFYLEDAELNIYSLEELCYYIVGNLYTLDRTLMTEELIAWIDREANEPELAEKLRQIKRNENEVYPFFMTILLGCGYLSKKELSECDATLKSLRNKSVFQCRKIRADHDLSRELYARAITEYRLLLESEEARKESNEELGNVWHNLGCAYAGLFLFTEAGECFKRAVEKNRSPESGRLLSLCRSFLDDGADLSLSEPDPLYEETVAHAKERRNARDTEGFYSVLAGQIARYKREYRKHSQIL